MVADTPYFSITGSDGAFRFRDLPPGDYEVRAWNLRGETTARAKVSEGTTAELNLRIDPDDGGTPPHPNKEGKKYSPSFDDGESY